LPDKIRSEDIRTEDINEWAFITEKQNEHVNRTKNNENCKRQAPSIGKRSTDRPRKRKKVRPKIRNQKIDKQLKNRSNKNIEN
jgi:hypothetical protein